MRALGALLILAGCADCGGGAPCGAGDAGASGLTVTADPDVLEYGSFEASANNDCSVSGAPTSITITGMQTSPAGAGFLTLCLPRPDLLDDQPVALVPNRIPPEAGDRVQVIDVSGDPGGGCTLELDSAGTFAATATFSGYCGEGLDPAGFALSLSGTLPGTLTCPSSGGSVTLEPGGSVAVTVSQ